MTSEKFCASAKFSITGGGFVYSEGIFRMDECIWMERGINCCWKVRRCVVASYCSNGRVMIYWDDLAVRDRIYIYWIKKER